MELNTMGRAATTADIAKSILFLSSPMASHITGVLLAVDGGTSLGQVKGSCEFGKTS